MDRQVFMSGGAQGMCACRRGQSWYQLSVLLILESIVFVLRSLCALLLSPKYPVGNAWNINVHWVNQGDWWSILAWQLGEENMFLFHTYESARHLQGKTRRRSWDSAVAFLGTISSQFCPGFVIWNECWWFRIEWNMTIPVVEVHTAAMTNNSCGLNEQMKNNAWWWWRILNYEDQAKWLPPAPKHEWWYRWSYVLDGGWLCLLCSLFLISHG